MTTVLLTAAYHHLELLDSKQLFLMGGLVLDIMLRLILLVIVTGAMRIVGDLGLAVLGFFFLGGHVFAVDVVVLGFLFFGHADKYYY